MTSTRSELDTVSLLGQAYSLLGFQIVDGVVGAGFPQKPKHSAVFAQIEPGGTRSSVLAARAGMTAQAMGEVIDELVELGYVTRTPDPSDGRAKLVVLTDRGRACVAAAKVTIGGIEENLVRTLGAEGAAELRRLLLTLLESG